MLQKYSDSEAGPLMLVNIALDLQILICTLLHPADILALRQTCKALQVPTRRRVVWMAALHRVCLDNSLFLPSFPIPDMSDEEIEHAAMAPRRWIELCASFENRYPNGSCAQLRPRTTRIIEDSSLATVDEPELFILPGGRYMVSYSPNGIYVWDLGYTPSADCKLIASVGRKGGSYDCMVQATPDGMGLIILSSRLYEHCSVYEIYPQSATPQLTQIANLDVGPAEELPAYLLPDRVLWYCFYEDAIIFRVWDYRMNYSICFSANVDVKEPTRNIEVIATKTAIIVLSEEKILVWAMPLLSPQPLEFFNPNPNLTHIPSLFGITLPNGIVRHDDDLIRWQTMSHWYCGSSQPLYFDIFRRDSKIHRFEIILKPNLFDTSLHLIKAERVPYNFYDATFHQYTICEDTVVTCWQSEDQGQIGLMSCAISHGGPATKMLLPPATSGYNFFSLCPASGRYVHLDSDIGKIVVVDLF